MTGRISKSSLAILGCLGLFLSATTACAPGQATASITATALPPLLTATVPCEQELVSPQIVEIQPVEPTPGSEVRVIGRGGYIQDTCGGTIEGSKTFQLYLDDQPVGELSCYVNRCEEKLMLPDTLSVGSHCLSVEIGICQFEFQTAGK